MNNIRWWLYCLLCGALVITAGYTVISTLLNGNRTEEDIISAIMMTLLLCTGGYVAALGAFVRNK